MRAGSVCARLARAVHHRAAVYIWLHLEPLQVVFQVRCLCEQAEASIKVTFMSHSASVRSGHLVKA